MCLVAAFVAAFVATGSARAQSASGAASEQDIADFSLEELLNLQVTTAGGLAINLEDAPGSLSVITRQQILDTHAQSLREVLNAFVPGFDVVPGDFAYGDRMNDGVYARGMLSDFQQQVLVLYNGQAKANESTYGGAMYVLGYVTLENVERIEISRTPVPLYGGQAITLINIITHERSVHGVEASVNFSTDEHTSLKRFGLGGRRFSVAGGWDVLDGKWHVGTSLQYFDDLGPAQRNPAGAGGFDNELQTLRVGVQNADRFTLALDSADDKFHAETWYQYTSSDAYESGLTASQSQSIYKYWSPLWMLNLKYKPTEHWELSLSGSRTGFWAIQNFGGPSGGGSDNYDVFGEALYKLAFEAAGTHSFFAGFKAEREAQYYTSVYLWGPSAAPDSLTESTDPGLVFAPNAARNVYALYAEDTWNVVKPLTLVLGARADEYWGYGATRELEVNPRAAAVWNVNKLLVLKGTYASAVRPPSIYDRLGKNLPPLVGSPRVTAERVQTAEVSAIFKLHGLRLQVTPWYQLWTDRIAYETTGATGATALVAQNAGTQHMRGLDAELWYYFTPRSYVWVNNTYLASHDDRGGHDTWFLPSEYLNAGVNYGHDPFNFNLYGSYRSRRSLPAILPINGANTQPFVTVNGSFAFKFWDGFQAYLLVENLLDRDMQVPLYADGHSIPLQGRTWNLGLRYNH